MDHATRQGGAGYRPWEYELLDAIATDSSDLVLDVSKRYGKQICWTNRVAETFGLKVPGEIHYLVASFDLKRGIGLTLFDLALLNERHRAAAAIVSAQQCLQSLALDAPLVPEDSVVIALVQCASEIGTIKANAKRLERHVRAAAKRGAKVVVLPETSVTGYLSQDLQTNWGLPGRPQSFPRSINPTDYAETSQGESVQHMASLARELSVYITVPYLEKDGERFYNSISFVGPESPPEKPALAHYRKNCPWPHPEKSWATPGEGVGESTYDTPFGRVGLAICFDIHSILSKYAQSGLWALLYPIAWVGGTDHWFGALLPERLASVNCPHYVLGANWATFAPASWDGAGGSTAYGPGGKVLARANEKRFRGCEDVVVVNIPTQKAMPQIGRLDLQRYEEWTREQVGTDYWRFCRLNGDMS